MIVIKQWLKCKIIEIIENMGIKNVGLKNKLMKEGKTRWLDVGSSRFDEGFMCLNIGSSENIDPEFVDKYYQADILDLKELDYETLGQFDLVRMQHVFEHFSFEEGETVLKSCSRLLKPNGYLLITVPDLRILIDYYLQPYSRMPVYVSYSKFRLPEDAPDSFIFAFHVHQFGYAPNAEPGDAHKWCYDYEGLYYQVSKIKEFKNIRRLDILGSLAEIPFTHNRPMQDVCIIAQKS